MLKYLSAVALLFVLAATTAQAQNLIANGNFQDGLKGWKMSAVNKTAVNLEVSGDYAAYKLTDNHAGLKFVHLNTQTALEQTVPTQAGESYVFGFGFAAIEGDKQLIVEIDGKPTYTYTIKQQQHASRFSYRHFVFSARQPQTTIRIYVASLSGDDKKGILLSDVLCDVEKEADLKLYYAY